MTARNVEHKPVESKPMASRYEELKKATEAFASHISIDLETLSTKTDAVILSIAIVCDNGRELEIHPDIDYQIKYMNRHVDGKTLSWWFGQKEAALRNQADAVRLDISDASFYTLNFLKENVVSTTLVWANSPSFDCDILASFLGHKPWMFNQERDVRTARMAVGRTEPEVAHSALSDARAQLQDVLRFMELVSPITNSQDE